MEKFLRFVEKWGNRLPDISILFLFALATVLLLSCALSYVDFNYYLPNADGTSTKIVIKNFLELSNFLHFISTMVNNFMSFPPLGITLVVTIGIGLAEASGMLRVMVIKISYITPKNFIVPVTAFISVIAHLISDSAYVFLMPVAAALFYSFGRHPVAGISVAFAGLAGGFAASLTPSAIDPIMQNLTQQASWILDSSVRVNVLCNYFVSAAGVLGVVVFCSLVCTKIVEPFLQKHLPVDVSQEDNPYTPKSITSQEQKAFKFAMLAMLGIVAIVVFLAYPEDSLLRGQNKSLTAGDSLLMKGLVPLLFLLFAIPGYVFGKISGAFPTTKEVSDAMKNVLVPLCGFLAFCFICGQFLYVFNTSNLSKLLAISGAEFLKSLQLPAGITIFGIILVTGVLNLFVTSATSKWSVLAPIFVPMLMLLGISPELTQAAFRVSDSAINVMTPLYPFYPLIIYFAQKYCTKMGVGTLSSIMIPYSLALMITLSATLYLFWFLGIPLGFDSGYTYQLPENLK